MPNTGRDAVCAGHRIEGGTDPAHPSGVLRSPTFTAYLWNTDVAAQLIPPTLVMQGLDDTDIPGGTGNAPAIYHALPTSMTNKVLVQLDCATHAMMWKAARTRVGVFLPRASPTAVHPIGRGHARMPRSRPALIEWITNGTFDIGTFVVDASGVARPDRT